MNSIRVASSKNVLFFFCIRKSTQIRLNFPSIRICYFNKDYFNTFLSFSPGVSISVEEAKYRQSEEWYASRRLFTFEKPGGFID